MYVVHVDRQRSLTGQTRRTLFVARTLYERGHRVTLIAHPESDVARTGREAGLDVLELPMRGPALHLSRLRAAQRLHGEGVDVIHCHGGRDKLLASGVARLVGIPHVVRTKHNHTPPRGRRSLRAYEACARIISVSDYVRQVLVDAGVTPERVVTISDAVDVERFAPRPRDPELARSLGISPDDVVIGNVSSLHARKGIDEVLRGFARLRAESDLGPRLKCLLVGKRSDPWLDLARELRVADAVIFPGFREDVPEMLSLLDVYVLMSRHEALGTSAVEAMAMGRPVVVSDVGGLAEAVAGGSGVRVPSGDVEGLVREVQALLREPARARALGKAARERALSHYSSVALAERTLALYAELLAGRARGGGPSPAVRGAHVEPARPMPGVGGA